MDRQKEQQNENNKKRDGLVKVNTTTSISRLKYFFL